MARIVLGGDLMLNLAKPGPDVLGAISPFLKSADLACANLEIPLTTSLAKTGRKSAEELKRKDQYILKASPEHAPFLSQAGIGLVSLGNNHCMDYGPAGLSEMTIALKQAGIVFAGAGMDLEEASQMRIVRLTSGVRVGLLSAMAFMTPKALAKTTPATPTSPGVNTLSFGGILGPKAKEYLADWIGRAHAGCDYVIVGVHWGVERKSLPTAYQIALGRAIVDAGADVVWGNHPHVLQGAEIYRGVPILYSMGNLVSSLPAETGLVRLTLGAAPHFEFFPAVVRGNKCVPYYGRATLGPSLRYRQLCQAIQTKYRNENSRSPLQATK